MDIEKEAEGIIRLALSEDLGALGDITTEAVVDERAIGSARLVAKSPLVVCGQPLATRVFELAEQGSRYTAVIEDGNEVTVGEVIGRVTGSLRSILTAERTALNFLCHMSGIATLTRKLVEEASAAGIQIMDTRKTHPGMRNLEKYAVMVGGGQNHRRGLYDGVIIKDNHVLAAGGIRQAVMLVRNAVGGLFRIEVEARTLDDVRDALDSGADTIMLDNMDPITIKQAVEIIGGQAKIEVSGGIKPWNLQEFLIPGVDAISMGFITMSAPAVDISLELDNS